MELRTSTQFAYEAYSVHDSIGHVGYVARNKFGLFELFGRNFERVGSGNLPRPDAELAAANLVEHVHTLGREYTDE